MARTQEDPRRPVWIALDARLAVPAWGALAVVVAIVVGWPVLLASLGLGVASAYLVSRTGHFSFLPSVLAFAGAGAATLVFSRHSVLGATIGAAIAGALVAFAMLFLTMWWAHWARKR